MGAPRSRGRTWSAASAVLVFLIVGCGGTSESITSSPRLLRVVMADDWANVPAVIDAVRTFEAEHEDVQVQVQGVPFSQIPEVTQTSIASEDPFDVVHWHAFAAAADGLAQPIGDLWQGTLDPDEYLPGAVDDVTWEGQLHGVPLDTNALVLFANPEMFERHGMEIPAGATTFSDLEAIAKRVTSADGSVRGIAIPSSTWFAYGWIRANGGELVEVDDDGTVRFSIDSPAVIEALGFLGALVERGEAFPPTERNVSNDAFALFRGGSVALHADGMWTIPEMEDAQHGWSPEVIPMPRGRDGSTEGTALGGSSLFIPPGVDDRELAFRFMVHLTSPERSLRLAKEEGRLPAQRAVFDDPFFDHPAFQVTVQQLEVAHPMKLIAFPEAQRAFVEAYEDILTGRATAEEALTRAQRAAERSMGQG